MKLSACFFLYHPNGFLRAYALSGIETRKAEPWTGSAEDGAEELNIH